jgi:DNA-binding beta-propeller fold protein YncE
LPVSTATGKVGALIPVAGGNPGGITITPNGKIAYVISPGGMTPVNTATNTAGTPIQIAGPLRRMVITPNSKTAYAPPGTR